MKIGFILLIVILLISFQDLSSQVINTQYGQVQGAKNGNVYQFLGIPFAKPPVGELRWKFPQPPDNWAGILQTTDFAPVCPQKHFDQGKTTYTLEGNEDCLYLNVWTPQTGTSNLPVLVFIHGGGNQQGSANDVELGTPIYFGKNMAERGNAVIVTIQYRLGPLGFLVHPGLEAENTNHISGNYAVMDQVLALTWVKNNISNFGGDSQKVMIFGESAGGIDAGNLLTSPLAAGLFQRVCIESASPVVNSYTDSKNKGIDFVAGFTGGGDDIQKISYMRSLPADTIIKNLTNPLAGGIVQLNWQPVVDQYVFTDFPAKSFESSNFSKVPVMIGSNSEEMSLSAPETVVPAMVTALIKASVPDEYQDNAFSLYPPGSDAAQARQSYVALLTDSQFTVTTRRSAQCISQNQTEPVWRYFFTYKHSIPALATYGSYHGMELFYVFNNWKNTSLGSGLLFKPQDDSVQKIMLNYWVNFARTGNPNGPGFTNWPQYKSSTDSYLEIKATPDGSQSGLRTTQCNLWDNVVGFAGCTSTDGLRKNVTSDKFKVFPNPCKEKFAIETIGGIQITSIHLYDFTGKEIRNKMNSSQMEIADLPPGIYLLKVIAPGITWKTKILKK